MGLAVVMGSYGGVRVEVGEGLDGPDGRDAVEGECRRDGSGHSHDGGVQARGRMLSNP